MPGAFLKGEIMPNHHRYLTPTIVQAWQVSKACSMATCVSVLNLGHVVLVRDSKNGVDPEQPIIELGSARWTEFVDVVAVRGGFDGRAGDPVAGGGVEVVTRGGQVYLTDLESGNTLGFTNEEWQAFCVGARAGEFDFGTDPILT